VNFVLIVGYLASFSYLLVATLTENRLVYQSDYAILWNTPVIAILVTILFAFVYLPLGIAYALLLLIIMRLRFLALHLILAVVAAFVLVLITDHLILYGTLDIARIVDRNGTIDLAIVGWLSIIVYLATHPHKQLMRREQTARIEHTEYMHPLSLSDEATSSEQR